MANTEKLNIPLRADIIQTFINMCFSENKNILYRDFTALYRLLEKCDTDVINMSINNISSVYYFEFLNFYLRERAVRKVSNKKFILGKLLEESANKEIYNQIASMTVELSDDDLYLTRQFINERLRFIHMYEGADDLEQLLVDLRTNNFSSLDDFSRQYEDIIKSHFTAINMSKSSQADILNDVELDGTGVLTLAEDIHNTLNTPGHNLSTGIEEIDSNYPIVKGELKLYGGPSGGFKSGMLLNEFFNCKLYNPDIVCRDPTKKPLLLYISMENTQLITFSRSLKLILNMNRDEIRMTDPSVMSNRFLRKFEEFPTNCKEAICKIKYYKSNEISVEDIYGIIEEEEQKGLEVQAVFIDYLKGLKPETHSRGLERRMQMADSSRAMADLAISKNIAVVSAFQLNRLAIEATQLNATHIQEAFAIIDHADTVAFIRRVYSPDHQRRFLQIFEGKMRNQEGEGLPSSDFGTFIPFDDKNTFKIMPTLHEVNPFRGQAVSIRLPGAANNTAGGRQGGPQFEGNTTPTSKLTPPRLQGGRLMTGNESVFASE